MGNLFSKKVEPKDELERIAGQLKQIDERITGLHVQRRTLSKFFMISVFVVLIGIAIDYVYKRPQSSMPLVFGCCFISFCVVYLMYHIVIARYYAYRTGRQYTARENLMKRKMKLLEEVKEKVNFNVARELILKYGNEEDVKEINAVTKPKTPLKSIPPVEATPNVPKNGSVQATPAAVSLPPKNPATIGKPIPFPNETPKQRPPMMMETPKPIRPFVGGSRTPMDKLVDFVIGDGPNNRYALICKNCETHNGMALPEEFDRLSYFCYRCKYHNQARAKKPSPPPREVSEDVAKKTKLSKSPSTEALNQENTAPTTVNNGKENEPVDVQ